MATIKSDLAENAPTYDRKSELKEFDESKVGVQGLIENGVTKVPQMFYCGNSNLNDVSLNPSADWRDTLGFFWAPHPPKVEELPTVGRDIVTEYSKEVMTLSSYLYELLSEAIGLNRFHLKEMGALVVNIGDLLQLVSNDKFKSVDHRVLANHSLSRPICSRFFFAPHPPKADELPPVCSQHWRSFTTCE
ncbi:hypothetical protein P8452_52659 [Trifolium repens]|nr:hypothetical protein P8452_52659 [Trifolium repens]